MASRGRLIRVTIDRSSGPKMPTFFGRKEV
jgi:hypothetical protein